MPGVSIYELRLTGFSFPAVLPNDKANFRIVAEVRYVTPEGGFASDHAVLPGLDTFWECATDKAAEPNYVRADGAASFDMTKVDAWDALMLMFRATSVHSVKLTVFDVNLRTRGTRSRTTSDPCSTRSCRKRRRRFRRSAELSARSSRTVLATRRRTWKPTC